MITTQPGQLATETFCFLSCLFKREFFVKFTKFFWPSVLVNTFSRSGINRENSNCVTKIIRGYESGELL